MNDYLSQFLALQPPGAALPRDPESVWARLLAALADGFGRVEARAGDLVTESDPRTCNDMLTDWERVCGLPAECMPTDSVNTLQVRRAAVVNVLNRLGGQTPEYFRRLAEIAGIEIDVVEYRPFLAGLSVCGDALNGPEEVRFVWQIVIRGQRVTWFRAGESECGERLCDFDPAEEIECLFRQSSPAHTELVIGYEADFSKGL